MYFCLQNDSIIKTGNMIGIFENNKGYARMKDLKSAGIQTRDVAKYLRDGIIEKIKPGLYKLIEFPWDEHSGFSDVCQYNKNAIICLSSAADYYGLTTFMPSEIYIAVPRNTPRFNLEYPPVRLYYFAEKYYKMGITELNTPSGTIKIYNKEKTLGDMFRYINKIGEDIVLESLKTYMNSKERELNEIIKYAEICGVENKMMPYLKSMI